MKVLRKVSNSYSIILRETFVSLFLISRILFGDEFMFWHEAQIGHIELVFLNFQPWSSEVYSQGEKYQLFPPPLLSKCMKPMKAMKVRGLIISCSIANQFYQWWAIPENFIFD